MAREWLLKMLHQHPNNAQQTVVESILTQIGTDSTDLTGFREALAEGVLLCVVVNRVASAVGKDGATFSHVHLRRGETLPLPKFLRIAVCIHSFFSFSFVFFSFPHFPDDLFSAADCSSSQ